MVNVDDTRFVLASGIRLRRETLGWSQQQLASEMIAAGAAGWKRATVAAAEREDKPRALSITDIAALCSALQCDVDDLLPGMPPILDQLRGHPGAGDTALKARAEAARREEIRTGLENRLAAALDIPVSELRAIVEDAYGRDLLTERDARLAGTHPGDGRNRAQRLGHAMRAIERELKTYLGKDENPWL